MGVKVTNNGFGTLSAGINSSATTITVDSGQGARFPALSSGDFFFATLIDTSNNLEIVKVTARSTDSMTVTRAQDNTSARAFSIGDRIELRPTAALFENAHLDNTPTSTGSLGLPKGTTAQQPTASATEGHIRYDTDDDVVYFSNGTSWLKVASVTAITPTAVSDQANTSTGSFSFPVGTEAQRPGSPAEGMTRYNSENDKLEVYANGAWQQISSNPPYDVTYMVVAGGGSGGTAGGGGGAGGMRQGTLTVLKGTTYTVTVGGGGAGGARSWGQGGVQGSDSVFGSITSIGGGLGGHGGGGAGGSGGGGAQGNGGAGTSGQGNNGGNGNTGSPGYPGGGGGGAGAVGANASNSTTAGNGGAGAVSAINSGLYAGGGGGGTRQGTAGAGANGGGGGSHNSNGTNGTATTGGGGGGSGGANIGTSVGAGGSGVVMLKVPDANYATSGVTGSPSTSQSGGFTTLTWTSSGTYTA